MSVPRVPLSETPPRKPSTARASVRAWPPRARTWQSASTPSAPMRVDGNPNTSRKSESASRTPNTPTTRMALQSRFSATERLERSRHATSPAISTITLASTAGKARARIG